MKAALVSVLIVVVVHGRYGLAFPGLPSGMSDLAQSAMNAMNNLGTGISDTLIPNVDTHALRKIAESIGHNKAAISTPTVVAFLLPTLLALLMHFNVLA